MIDLNLPYTKEVDARGLNCPLPILRTKKALADILPGDVLRVLSTDPHSERDFVAFAKQTGHELVQTGKSENIYVFYLRRSI
jgi:tRNA 2-thiouridine synthesizing protein A